MQTCKTCIFFDNRENQKRNASIPRTEKIGFCKQICSTELKTFSHVHIPQPGLSMMVGENFGCVNHKLSDNLN